jgi:hypothetical protein
MRDALRRAASVGLVASLVILALSFVLPPIAAQITHDPSDALFPAAEAAALVESDTTLISPPCRSVYVATTGDVVVDMQRTGTSITYAAVPAGTVLPIRIKRFKVASTATGVCLY